MRQRQNHTYEANSISTFTPREFGDNIQRVWGYRNTEGMGCIPSCGTWSIRVMSWFNGLHEFLIYTHMEIKELFPAQNSSKALSVWSPCLCNVVFPMSSQFGSEVLFGENIPITTTSGPPIELQVLDYTAWLNFFCMKLTLLMSSWSTPNGTQGQDRALLKEIYSCTCCPCWNLEQWLSCAADLLLLGLRACRQKSSFCCYVSFQFLQLPSSQFWFLLAFFRSFFKISLYSFLPLSLSIYEQVSSEPRGNTR